MMRVRSLALFALLSASAQADVLVVDGNDPAAFGDIQAAVDAASNGDTIWVQDGDYAVFEIDAKSLEQIGVGDQVRCGFGATSGLSTLLGITRVRNLSAGQRVTIRELDVGFLDVEACAGQVWLESMRSLPAWTNQSFQNLVRIAGCDDVILVDFEVPSADLSALSGPGAPRCFDADVAAFDRLFSGGAWGDGGRPGLALELGPELFASGCVFAGSDGIDGSPLFPAFYGGSGGCCATDPRCANETART